VFYAPQDKANHGGHVIRRVAFIPGGTHQEAKNILHLTEGVHMDLEVIYRVPAHDLRRLSSGDYPAVGTAVANFNRDAEPERLQIRTEMRRIASI
jgi:hypothetical protein